MLAQYIFYATAVGLFLIDQITKSLALKYLADAPTTIIPGFFKLSLVLNKGAAFGILPDAAILFIILTLAVLFVIVKLKQDNSQSKLFSVGLGLLAGGACGNLVDRLTRTGRDVVDFLDFTFGSYSYPTFNIADIGVVAGIFLVVFYVYFIEKKGIYLGHNRD